MTRRSGAALFCFLFLSPGIAAAHAPIEGIGSLLNGMLHPILTPSHLLLLLATGLFFGQRGFDQVVIPLIVSIAAVVLGLIMSALSAGSQFELFILAWSTIIGILVAVSARLPTYWYFVVGPIAGFSIGFDSVQEMLTGRDKIIALLGTGVGVYFFSLYPIGLAEYCNRKEWMRTGIRVLGSWIAASSILVLVLSFAKDRL
jgi:hydrogenase/urease accessory protein HupE